MAKQHDGSNERKSAFEVISELQVIYPSVLVAQAESYKERKIEILSVTEDGKVLLSNNYDRGDNCHRYISLAESLRWMRDNLIKMHKDLNADNDDWACHFDWAPQGLTRWTALIEIPLKERE